MRATGENNGAGKARDANHPTSRAGIFLVGTRGNHLHEPPSTAERPGQNTTPTATTVGRKVAQQREIHFKPPLNSIFGICYARILFIESRQRRASIVKL
jgi:hypothetical protein